MRRPKAAMINDRLGFLGESLFKTGLWPGTIPASYLSFAANAFGTSASSVSALSSATAVSCKFKIRVDPLRTIAASTTAGFWQISASGGTTGIKLLFFCTTDASGNISFTINIPGSGGFQSSSISQSTGLPAAGNDIIVYADNTSATARQIQIYTTTGTSVLSGTNASNLGALPTGNGFVFLNDTNASTLSLADLIDGIAFYTTGLTGTNQWSKPTSSDSGLATGWLFNDGTSGGNLVGGGPVMSFTGTVSSVGGGSW